MPPFTGVAIYGCHLAIPPKQVYFIYHKDRRLYVINEFIMSISGKLTPKFVLNIYSSLIVNASFYLMTTRTF